MRRGQLGPLVDQWIDYQQAAGLSANTQQQRWRVMRSLTNHAGVHDAADLTRAQVMAWLGNCQAAWTRVSYFRTVAAFDRWCVEFDVWPELRLVKGLRAPRSPHDTPRPVPDEVVNRLLGAKLTRRANAFVRLALFEALRVHEVAQIRAEDFDHDTGWLMVRGKGNVLAPIPIHPNISELSDSMPQMGFWFPSAVDPTRHIRPMSVSTTVKNAMRSVGFDGTAHQLRHSAATRLQRGTHDLRLTQAMLRHSNVATTTRYAAVANRDLQASLTHLDWKPARPTTEEPAVPQDRAELVATILAVIDAQNRTGER